MTRLSVRFARFTAPVALCLLSLTFGMKGIALAAPPTEYVWLEGEALASANVTVGKVGWGRKEFLSGHAWAQINIKPEDVEKGALPEGGAILKYPFTLAKGGKWQVWNRIGYEFVRSPFDWRVDGGAWKTVTPEELTTDLTELETWNEVAWLRLTEQDLAPGAHTLEIRLTKTLDDKGKPTKVLYASDALCLTLGDFHPNGRFKPGEVDDDPKLPEARKTVFSLPGSATPDTRSEVKLQGIWEVCRADEQLPGPVAEPMKADLPAEPHWKAIPVPGDKNESRPDLIFAHRLWYRTRVEVPATQAGRGFWLVFPQNSLNTTVYVNGIYCGFNKDPHVRFAVDVSKAIKPGAVNEIRVGIRDAWYGYSANPKDPLKLRRKFNIPLSFTRQGFQDLAYPVWGAFQSGILLTPSLVSGGAVYAADVFVKPSVLKKELAAEVTLTNPGGEAVSGEITWEAIDAKTGQVAKTFAPKPFSIAAGVREQKIDLTGAWSNPTLWWPDAPYLYKLRATVQGSDKPRDVSETRFGFREWGTRGKDFLLNGIAWRGWADTHAHTSKEQWLNHYRKTNQRFTRLAGLAQGGPRWYDLTPGAALDWFDENGVVVRRSGILDGEVIGYMAVENDPDLKKLYGTDIKQELMNNWVDQMVAQVREERNHPSVHVWSLENEWLYINCINLYGNLMDKFEAEVTRCSDAVRKADPTRLTMVDGGGATRAQTLPVHGDHYVASPGDTRYPSLAYEPFPEGGGRGRWLWDQKRPRYIGEELYAAGHNPAYSLWGGEEVFLGQQKTRKAVGNLVNILTQGYRWQGYGAWHFWQVQGTGEGQYRSNALRAVFVRQWDSAFGSGQKVKRTFGLFNDTHHADPITFTWTLTLGGKRAASRSATYTIPSGENKKWDEVIPLPPVTTRQEGALNLALVVGGKTVFTDSKPVSVLPVPNAAALLTQPARVAAGPGARVATPRLTADSFAVYDPQGSVTGYLRKAGVPFTAVNSLAALPVGPRVLLVGRNALTERDSASTALAAWALGGRRVVLLEQKNPLRYAGLASAEMEAQTNEGRTAYIEDRTHPILKGLTDRDFFTWGAGEVVYRNAYLKPARGGKSLVQAHSLLKSTALAEVPVGDGLILVSQLVIGEKIGESVVARQLLNNLLAYAATYTRTFRPVTATVAAGSPFAKALDQAGLQYRPATDPLSTLSAGKIAVVEATPANLKTLSANLPKVRAFTRSGGTLFLHGLTPEGLTDYNKLVGYDHLIRPFRRERVAFPAVKDPLTAGIPISDIALYSSEKIFPWQEGNYVSSDTFTYCVDYDDVAPFATLPSDYHYNTVNGMVSADSWKYIFSFDLNADPVPQFTLRFPKPQEITEIEWIGNALYHLATKVELTSEKDKKVTLNTQPNNEPQTIPIPGGLVTKELNLRIADWQKVPNVGANVVGIDNIRLKARRPADFPEKVKPLDSAGGMMRYPQGRGAIILCNLNFKETEDVPDNGNKKRNVLATLLRNLKAPFAGGKTVIAGAKNLVYRTVDLAKHANQYRTERGWFGAAKFTFAALPTGRQTFAGVPFEVYEFPTSPVPTAVMLGGAGVPNNLPEEVKGIPVNRKADALFFLQTARLDSRRNERERGENKKYEMARYIVTYADGKTEIIPLYAEIDLEDYRQKVPMPLPGAQLGWTRPYEGGDLSATAYVKQWNNPRPTVEIKSIDLVYGPDRRGVPVLLALTAATTSEGTAK